MKLTRRELYEEVFEDVAATDRNMKELVDLLERVYPLVVGGTQGTRRCSNDAANKVQELLIRYGRPTRPPGNFGEQELEDLLV
jgi:hypothetical protein